jgi:hypothetical protein
MRKKKASSEDPMLEVVNEAILWIARDLRRKKQELTHTIFTASELNEKAGLNLSSLHTKELMDYLSRLNFVVRTDHIGTTGHYYNVHRKVFTVLHKGLINKRFVKKVNNPAKGWCLTQTDQKTYRMGCSGRKCKFYLDSAKECIQGKFFVK